MSRLFIFRNKAAVRGFIAATMLGMFVAILATFIVNPSALNPEKNPAINILLGLLIGELKRVIEFYFNYNQEEGNKNEKSIEA